MTTTTTPVDNGVDIEFLRGAREALTAEPAGAKFTVAGHQHLGARHPQPDAPRRASSASARSRTRPASFRFDADHPELFSAENNGATPVEILLASPGELPHRWHRRRGAEPRDPAPLGARTIEGDMDVRGILGIDSDVRNGFSDIKVTYAIDADASAGGHRGAGGPVAEALRRLRHPHQPDQRHRRGRLSAAGGPSRGGSLYDPAERHTPPATVGRDGHRRRRHRGRAGGHRHRRRDHEVHPAPPVGPAVGRALPVPRREDAELQREPGARPLPLLGLPGARRRHHLRPGGGAPRLRRRRRAARRLGGHHAALLRQGRGRDPQAARPAREGGGAGRRLVPRAAAVGARRGRRAQVPARARPERRRGARVPHRLGARRVAGARASPQAARRRHPRHRPRIPQPQRPADRCVPGTDPVPDLRRQRRRRRLRGTGDARGRRPEVQEHAGDRSCTRSRSSSTPSTGRRRASSPTTAPSCARATPTSSASPGPGCPPPWPPAAPPSPPTT